MKKILFTIFTVLLLSLTSCGQTDPNKNIDEGKIEGNIYTSQEIGWTIVIPKGWTIVDKEKNKEINEKGLKALEETLEGEVDYSKLKNLISLQKDQFNNFQSTSEPFELEYDGEWEENNSALKEIIYKTYLNQGIKADSSATTVEKIDGLDFQKYSFTIYSPKGEALLKQIMFSRLINGFDFGVNINYNNDKDRDELLKVFRNSKFKK
ncbi:hypothetical protein [Flavobacterium sp. FPG59]|jgi:hypothetical protein|uniref:hypothetical protein n=1 Tax=Flavobacterium sp. FPG59 TaxID=1929267 RepID=UPI000A3800BB|nr:hypothetical protein [Flavobacterium sp. FPG59]OUD35277.1 hypothetical protein FPG59_10870 [Flavobacterium sp. FPG59]